MKKVIITAKKKMKRGMALTALALALVLTMATTKSYAQLDFGSDVVSRYIWRGWDFGNAVSVQPWMAYASGGFEVGAWSSWAIDAPGANENDLYISYSTESFGLTVTDYYFPGGPDAEGSYGFFDYDPDMGAHIIEVLGSVGVDAFSAAAGVNVLGDDDNSIWLEAGYEIVSTEDISAGLTAGLGNGLYTLDGDFMLTQLGLTASKDIFFASYIINPDQEVSWLFFGVSF